MDIEGFVLGLVLGACVAVIFAFVTGSTYKDGFIDAKTGKQTYVLETQPDSTRIWVKQENQ